MTALGIAHTPKKAEGDRAHNPRARFAGDTIPHSFCLLRSLAPLLHILQEEVKLCNFSSRYLMTDEMKSIDNAMYKFMEREKVARKLLVRDMSPKDIAEVTELPLYWVIDLKKKMELAEV